MFGVLRRLFSGADTVEAENVPPRELHWRPTGMFAVTAAGASYHLAAIAKLAQNPRGQTALVFCTARLVPEDSNPNDANAVGVWIQGEKVGYLAKDFAPQFRGLFRKFGLPLAPTSCDAAISNGLLVEGEQYSYTIELDLAPEPEPPTACSPTYPSLSRQDPAPAFFIQGDGSYLATFRLGPRIVSEGYEHWSVGSWTADHWSAVSYYVENPQGIGLGQKLFEVPKEAHRRIFRWLEPDVKVVSFTGRMVTASLRVPSESEIGAAMAPYLYVLSEEAASLEPAQTPWSSGAPSDVRVHGDTIAQRDLEWLSPFVPAELPQALQVSRQQYEPGPLSASDLALELRAAIRAKRTAKQPHTELLLALYGACTVEGFVKSLNFAFAGPSTLLQFVDLEELCRAAATYDTLGYQHITCLGKTDVKWLVAAFGEPTTHRLVTDAFAGPIRNAISRYCWTQYRDASNACHDKAPPSMRQWLARTAQYIVTYG